MATKARQYGLRTLFALVFIVAATGACIRLYKIKEERTGEAEVAVRMRLLIQAMRDYDTFEGRLPQPVAYDVNGDALRSWRLSLVPLLDLPTLPQYDSHIPWNTGRNTRLLREVVSYYCYSVFGRACQPQVPQNTNVMVVVGPDTPLHDVPHALSEVDPDTILLIETAKSSVHWMQPGDLSLEHFSQAEATSETVLGVKGRGFHIGFADGEVWMIKRSTPLAEVRKLLTVQGGLANERENIFSQYRILK